MIDTVTLVQNLADTYGLAVKTIERLNVGADPTALVYKAIAQDQSAYFIKVKKGTQIGLSTIISDFLHTTGVQNIIPCIRTTQGEPCQILDNLTITVFPYIEGQDGFNTDLQNHQWQDLGKTIKQIHTLKLPPSIQNQIPQETYSQKWHQILQPLDELINGPIALDLVAFATMQFLKHHQSTVQTLLDHAERLSQRIENHNQDFVLCHADLHAGNIMIDQKGKIFFIDWDQPILAPKERDLMFIGGGVGNVWNKDHEEKSFYEGYGEVKINLPLLAYYRIDRILEDIAIYCQLLLQSSSGGLDREKWYQELTSQFDNNGVVAIALETAATVV
ncbi:MAG: aminoglycoside phosphotransferase family protein [Candidatus Paracaedibacteraceae bacterium]|nr:aminoglycoside phosphotransferase family protein [Candidatus Paracaedibacteraceae bacterium]